MNQIVLVGKLISDPVRISNKQVNVTISVTRRYKNNKGVYEDDLINCVMWSAVGDSVIKYSKNNDVLGIKGRLESRMIKGKANEDIIISEVIAESVTLLADDERK